MAHCTYCGKWAGFFEDTHQECQDKHDQEEAERDAQRRRESDAVKAVEALLVAAPANVIDVPAIAARIDAAAEGNSQIVLRAMGAWLEHLVANPPPDATSQEQVETAVAALLGHYGILGESLPNNLWGKFVRVCACGDLQAGKLPARVAINGNLPFNLENGETVVWVFNGVEYLEDKTVRSSTRGYGGVSIRVMPGIYAHAGQSAPASTTQGFVSIDKGTLALTERALLFSGAHKALRLKYKDLASFTRYDYGFAVCKGTQSARNLGFEVPDPLAGFPFGMLQGLAKLNAASNVRVRK